MREPTGRIMIVALLMHFMNWADLWYAHPGPNYWRRLFRFGPRWHAGRFTGPQNDLICTKACATNEEAELWLSPQGWTPLDAVLRAMWKHMRTKGQS